MVNYRKSYLICVSFLIFSIFINIIVSEKLTYLSTERPYVDYNKNYVRYGNLTSSRLSRRSPLYYVNINADFLIPLDNKLKVDFYFYQYLTNGYQPTFVEMHFKFCDLIEKDMFFGEALRQGVLKGSCPYPPGVYNLSNMTVLPEAIPNGFPFTKGRIYCNITYLPKKEKVAWGHIDMELKQIRIENRRRGSKL